MTDKKQPPSASLRRNLYWPADMDEKIAQVAEILHGQGVKGLFNSSGNVNRTAVIRHLVDETLKSNPRK